LVLVWTLVVAASVAWNIAVERHKVLDSVWRDAVSDFEKDLAYRRWNSDLGGVYAPVMPGNPPNPWLVHPERDLLASSGKLLTMINPAYMVRQVHGVQHSISGRIGHMTSLKPIRPQNAPDAWEAAALRAFASGTPEVTTVADIDGITYFRLMRPFFTERSCLVCHALQGYHVGDVRGGLSVGLPIADRLAESRAHQARLCLGHAIIYVLGLAGYLFWRRRFREQERLRRELTQMVDDEQRRLVDVAANLPGAVFQLALAADGAHRFTFVSEGIQALTGLTAAQVGADFAGFLQVVHADDRSRVQESLHAAAATSCPWVSAFRVAHADAEPRWLRASAIPRMSSSSTSLWNGVLLDISEQRRFEEQLRAARQAAEVANAAKSEFLANMSHEIRTPMNGVIGFTDLLSGTDLTAKQRHYVDIIHRSGDALLAVINNILDYSKLEAHKLELERVPLAVRALVAEVGDLFSASVHRRGLTWSVAIDPAVPAWVQGDPARLRQVLFNLVANAVKFTERGGIDLSVRPCGPVGTEVPLRFAVQDTGPGIDAAGRQRLFRPFSQVDASTTRKHGGTGLGLAICHRIVEAMGGEIGVDSEPGRGATFWFTVTLAGAPAAGLPTGAGSPTGGAAGDLGLHVLLAEDDPISRDLAVNLLQVLGCRVTAVGDGQAAVQKADQGGFDVILMDVQMGGMDGLAATAAIRAGESAMPGRRRVPIVAVTAHATREDRERSLAAGMDDHLAKPLGRDALVTTLQRLSSRGS